MKAIKKLAIQHANAARKGNKEILNKILDESFFEGLSDERRMSKETFISSVKPIKGFSSVEVSECELRKNDGETAVIECDLLISYDDTAMSYHNTLALLNVLMFGI